MYCEFQCDNYKFQVIVVIFSQNEILVNSNSGNLNIGKKSKSWSKLEI